MNRTIVRVASAVAFCATASLAGAQNNNNVGMPWEAIRAATRGVYDGMPPAAQKTEPFKIFDNIYYVGLETIGSYLITTSDGLILMDATYADTADIVLEGVRKLGFDPAQIKYIVITHGHNDHFAGAGRIKQVTGARVGLTLPDWENVEKLQASASGNQSTGLRLTRDLVVKDGDALTLGDTTLKFHVMPGHTAGNIVTEMQAKAGARTFRTLVGVAFAPGPGLTRAALESNERLKRLGPWDALLTSHSYLAPVAIPLTARQILGGEPLPPNPTGHQAAAGSARINAYLDQIRDAIQDRLAREKSGQTARTP
jgi:metallo-beta-lactamase class B